jgi:hypothetical protein
MREKIESRVITFPDISTCHRGVMSNTASLLGNNHMTMEGIGRNPPLTGD